MRVKSAACCLLAVRWRKLSRRAIPHENPARSCLAVSNGSMTRRGGPQSPARAVRFRRAIASRRAYVGLGGAWSAARNASRSRVVEHGALGGRRSHRAPGRTPRWSRRSFRRRAARRRVGFAPSRAAWCAVPWFHGGGPSLGIRANQTRCLRSPFLDPTYRARAKHPRTSLIEPRTPPSFRRLGLHHRSGRDRGRGGLSPIRAAAKFGGRLNPSRIWSTSCPDRWQTTAGRFWSTPTVRRCISRCPATYP